jgi:hypothetical protein
MQAFQPFGARLLAAVCLSVFCAAAQNAPAEAPKEQPTNLTLSFLVKDRVEIVTGLNLPMVLKCASLQKSGRSVSEIAHASRDRAQRSVCVASDLLADEGSGALSAERSEEP